MNINAKRKLLEELKIRITQGIQEHLVLLITTKHLTTSNEVDLFIVLDNPPTDDPYNVKAYIKLIGLVKAVEEDIGEENKISIVDFSTFRIESYHCRIMHLEESLTTLHLHLLIYPTIAKFLSWENHSVISSICNHCDFLYGRKDILEEIRTCIEINSFEDRIQPLVSVLFETYRNIIPYISVPDETERILLSEGLKKLQYVLRFTLWELLWDSIQEIPSPEADAILSLAKDKDIDRDLIDLFQKVKELKETEITVSDIKILYEQCMFGISKLFYNIKESKKNEHLK